MTQRTDLIVQPKKLLYIDRIVDRRGLRQRVITQPRPLGDISDQICCDALHGGFQDIVGCDR
jgi:hypothetical protein